MLSYIRLRHRHGTVHVYRTGRRLVADTLAKRIGTTSKAIIMIRNGLYSVISKLLDGVEGGIQLWTALALLRSEDLTRQALGMYAKQRSVLGVARDDGEMIRSGLPVAIGAEAEGAVFRRDVCLDLEDDATRANDGGSWTTCW